MSQYFEVWIGLVEVAPLSGSVKLNNKAAGAYANFLAWANGQEEFCRLVAECLATLDFRFVNAEDVEPLLVRLDRSTVDDELLDLANEVRETQQVRFGSFYTFPDDRQ